MERIHYSGGAFGADITWDRIGKKYFKQDSRHFYLVGFKTPYGNTPAPKETVAAIADPWLIKVNEKILHRKFPTSKEFVNALLRRNYLQVVDTDGVFAIATFDSKGVVKGGTAWAVYMAILMGKCVNLFDQEKNQWYKSCGTVDMKVHWTEIETPVLPFKYTGIGTRELNEAGKKAIEDCIKHTVNSLTNSEPKQ